MIPVLLEVWKASRPKRGCRRTLSTEILKTGSALYPLAGTKFSSDF